MTCRAIPHTCPAPTPAAVSFPSWYHVQESRTHSPRTHAAAAAASRIVKTMKRIGRTRRRMAAMLPRLLFNYLPSRTPPRQRPGGVGWDVNGSIDLTAYQLAKIRAATERRIDCPPCSRTNTSTARPTSSRTGRSSG